MSDDFIPLNQSTPVQGEQNGCHNNWNQKNRKQRGYKHKHNNNNSQHSNSFWSDNNSSYEGHDNKSNIDAYLHPSMLKDPWAHLIKKDK